MDIYREYSELEIVKDGAVLTISLNNPPMNPIAGKRHRELSRIFRDVNEDADVRVVILTAPGDVFSAGGDVKRMAKRLEDKDFDSWRELMLEGCEIVYSLLDCRKPTIARINGDCLGLGATIALLCDISVIVETAMIGDPHVKIGLIPGDGGALIWPQHVGYARAKEYLLTGENLSGREAAAIGLVTHAVPREQLDEKVLSIAQKIAALPGPATSGTKIAMNSVMKRNFSGLMEAHLGIETWAFLSREHEEMVFALRDRWAKKG